MSNWYTDKICNKCGKKIITNGKEEWCENCKIIKEYEDGYEKRRDFYLNNFSANDFRID